MLRPSSHSLLASSRGARRRNRRADRRKAASRLIRYLFRMVGALSTLAIELLVLAGAPIAYLASSFAVFDLPAGWMFGHGPITGRSFGFFVAAVVVAVVGINRAVQGAPPVVPVRPKFARRMLALSWAAGLLLTIVDFAA